MTSPDPMDLRRVLVIDDQPEIHADYRKILVPPESSNALQAAKSALFGAEEDAPALPRFALECASQGQEGVRLAQNAAAEQPFQVAFVDMRMPPGWDGLETIRRLWESDPRIQIVLCTAYSDRALDEVTRDLGHADKLLVLKKPFEPIEVQQLALALSEKWRAERDARIERDRLELIVQERTRDAQHAALHDRLTSLPNRVFTMDRIAGCLELARRDPTRHFSVLFIDIDGFKSVNDALGHAAGDQLLVLIAERMRHVLRAHDSIAGPLTAARLGGDEFLVVAEGLRRGSDAARIADRLIQSIAEPYDIDSQRIQVSASIGIATSDRVHRSAGRMIREADIAMYRAKQRGRNRYVLFDEDMDREVSTRLRLEVALREAVAEDALGLAYQPILDLRDGALIGFEALVRWRHPTLGPVAAIDLITAAEETGLIRQLGLQLMRRGCRQLAAWHRDIPGAAHLRLMLNLSRRQLVDAEFALRVADEIRLSGVDPTKLGLEITETAVVHDLPGAVAVLHRLRELGARILLDDFGSGYTAISHLDQMPIDAIKIERAFISGAHQDKRRGAMLKALVALAGAYDLDVVAEGVETASERDFVLSLGIERGQGWLYAPAVPPEQAEAMIRAGRLDAKT